MPNSDTSFKHSTRSNAAHSPAAQADGNAVQLLVSVRDVSEARLAMQFGVDWIDLKNPSAGALGAPTPATMLDVGIALRDWPCRSVALGELMDWADRKVDLLEPIVGTRFPIVKFGLAGMAGQPSLARTLSTTTAELGPHVAIVPVIYADHTNCAAPPPEEVLDAAIAIGAPYLLIDTYEKRGLSLLDFISPEKLQTFVLQASLQGIQTVVAGSIQREQLSVLREIGAYAIGVRGAVCSEDRASTVCPKLLAEWVEIFRTA